MRNRIDTFKPLPAPRAQSHTQQHADQLLVLIGDDSDADEVLRFFREMWPEVEGTEIAPPRND